MKRRTFLRNGAASGLVAAVVPGVASSSESGPAAASGSRVREISTNRAPKPVGPFSQAIKANGLIFVAGQTARDPQTGQVIEGDITVQTERVMENLKAILEAAGSTLEKAVKASVFLKDLNDFAAMNAVYARYMAPAGVAPPARTTVQAARLPGDILVEIDVIAEG